MAPLEIVDISHPRHKADPYPFYARLRAEAPVCRVDIPPGPQEAWLVSRYADVYALGINFFTNFFIFVDVH